MVDRESTVFDMHGISSSSNDLNDLHIYSNTFLLSRVEAPL